MSLGALQNRYGFIGSKKGLQATKIRSFAKPTPVEGSGVELRA